MAAQKPDNIELVLPARPEYARVARLTVAALASRAGFGYDDVEDLRIAVGEVCSLLLSRTDEAGAVRFSFVLDASSLRVGAERCDPEPAGGEAAPPGSTESGRGQAPDTDHRLSAQILEAVVDEAEILEGGDRVRLVKGRADR